MFKVKGNPQLSGRFICCGDPDPPGAKNLLDKTGLPGNIIVTPEACTGSVGSSSGSPIVPRAWAQSF